MYGSEEEFQNTSYHKVGTSFFKGKKPPESDYESEEMHRKK